MNQLPFCDHHPSKKVEKRKKKKNLDLDNRLIKVRYPQRCRGKKKLSIKKKRKKRKGKIGEKSNSRKFVNPYCTVKGFKPYSSRTNFFPPLLRDLSARARTNDIIARPCTRRVKREQVEQHRRDTVVHREHTISRVKSGRKGARSVYAWANRISHRSLYDV